LSTLRSIARLCNKFSPQQGEHLNSSFAVGGVILAAGIILTDGIVIAGRVFLTVGLILADGIFLIGGVVLVGSFVLETRENTLYD
jgi:hypothetical protein